MRRLTLLAVLAAWLAVGKLCFAYPTVFIAAPKTTGRFPTQSVSEWGADGKGESGGVRVYHANAQLIIRDDDGTERVLIGAGVFDFSVCHDGRTILASIVDPLRKSSDIWEVDSVTGVTKRITDHPAWECQPVECGDGKIAFLSDRDNWRNPHENYRAFAIYRMRRDGREQEMIWFAGLGGVYGLAGGPDGRLYYTSGENQGWRAGAGENWGIWSINPDGSDFQPEISALGQSPAEDPYDWPCISSLGDLLAAKYYDTRIYGKIDVCPPVATDPFQEQPELKFPQTKFGHPLWTNNPPVRNGFYNGPTAARGVKVNRQLGHQRRGMYSLCDWAGDSDIDPRNESGAFVGHVTHPAPLPGNGALLTWTGNQGDANMNLGVYAIDDITQVSMDPSDMRKVVDEPNRHEWMGRPLVAYKVTYGIDRPATPTKRIDPSLPIASPYGVLGSSSVDFPEYSNHAADRSKLKLSPTPPVDPEWMRILAFQPTHDLDALLPDGKLSPFQRSIAGNPGVYVKSNYEGFTHATNERTGFYEKLIPLKKYRGPNGELHLGPNPPEGYTLITRKDGRPDTSFACELPANQPWTVQLLNAKKEAVVTANTWHQVVSRESRTDCQGCHNHWQPDLVAFSDTVAGSAEYPRLRLDKIKTIIWDRDIKPFYSNQTPWTDYTVRPFASAAQSVDDNPDWTEEQRELFRAWQDTGMLGAGRYSDFGPKKGQAVQAPEGPYDDVLGPTLVVERYTDATYVGAADPQSGLKEVKVNDEIVSLDAEGVWKGPPIEGVVLARATDNRGRVAALEDLGTRIETPPDPDPDPDPDECEELRRDLDRLEAEITRLKRKIDAAQEALK